MKTAILVDGGYYRKRAVHVLGKKTAKDRAQELYDYCYKHLFSNKSSSQKDYLYRIFYYDCPPIDKQIFHPLLKKNIDFIVKEDEEGWHFDLPSMIRVYGKLARLANRNDILQKSSDKIINLELDLAAEYQLSDAEYQKRVSNEKWKSAGNFVLGVIAAPFVIAWGILTIPVWFYAVTQ